MHYINLFIEKLVALMLDMAPWLMFGFLIAGILHVFFPECRINQLLGRSNLRSVIRAALIGIPLPLCSCGVIPTGVSIYKNGASKGASISFLISTPQTGVDSIAVTYSMLGLPFALVRPVVALLTGVFGGVATNKLQPADGIVSVASDRVSNSQNNRTKNIFLEVLRYAYIDFLADIAKWLVIGLLVAALIAVFVPDDFFATYIHSDLLGMLIILAASVPVYICATSSVPIAAVLMMKGISPGAALVFLMAGPATNAATIAVIGKSMGRKTLVIYLSAIISGALLSGIFINSFLPREWFLNSMAHMHMEHQHGFVPYWLQVTSAILMTGFLLNFFFRKFTRKLTGKNDQVTNKTGMKEIKVFVRGMNCSHCKMNVESNLKKLEGIENIVADVDKQVVTLTGEKIDLDKVKDVVESIGYTYDGKVV
jgi:uncharacterized membrane protein YraQ (UPF0718 family)/copper chaperone CopZ